MKLSDYVVRFVADLGVKHVFLVTGGGALHLNDSLARCPDIQFTCNHHEQASAIAAENYAKATGSIGVAMVTTGPGGSNAVTGVAGAWFDSTPCLFLSGQAKRPDRMFAADGTPLGVRQRGIQELDIVTLVSSITKYAVTITDPNSIRYHLEKAVHLATTGRSGPVWIDIPLDVQAISIDVDKLPGFTPEPVTETKSLANEVSKTIEALNRAERPVILCGNGVRLAHAEALIQQLVERYRIPVLSTWVTADLFDFHNPLYMGRPGTIAARGSNYAIQNSDFLLVLGTRLDFPVSGWNPSQLARGAHKVMVDIDQAELNKLSNVFQQSVCADAGDFLREFEKQSPSIVARDREAWRARCREWKQRYPIIQDKHRGNDGLVSIYQLAEVLSSAVGEGDVLISGSSGTGIEIFIYAFPNRKGQRVFHTAGLGAMGYGIAASIGACLGRGCKPTVCVDGDGGFMLNIQELATVSYLQLPIKFFVLNNDGYAAIRGSQKNFFGAPNIGCDPPTGLWLPNILEVAQSFKIGTAEIRDQHDLAGQVKRVLAMPGPVICDVRVLADEPREPRVTSVQRADGSFLSKPLEDMAPLLDREEFLANMIVPPIDESTQ
jgi:acetolactate synthase-1/2/3 large subunit